MNSRVAGCYFDHRAVIVGGHFFVGSAIRGQRQMGMDIDDAGKKRASREPLHIGAAFLVHVICGADPNNL
jgi:hypothetical protein